MKIQILDEAKADLIEGFLFYEKKSAGLGRYFLDSLYSDIDSLLLYAGIHRKIYKSHYRLLSKRFPYAVFYRINETSIMVDAVLDCRKNPKSIENRLS